MRTLEMLEDETRETVRDLISGVAASLRSSAVEAEAGLPSARGGAAADDADEAGDHYQPYRRGMAQLCWNDDKYPGGVVERLWLLAQTRPWEAAVCIYNGDGLGDQSPAAQGGTEDYQSTQTPSSRSNAPIDLSWLPMPGITMTSSPSVETPTTAAAAAAAAVATSKAADPEAAERLQQLERQLLELKTQMASLLALKGPDPSTVPPRANLYLEVE